MRTCHRCVSGSHAQAVHLSPTLCLACMLQAVQVLLVEMQLTSGILQGEDSPFTAVHLAPHLSSEDMRFVAILFLNRAQAGALGPCHAYGRGARPACNLWRPKAHLLVCFLHIQALLKLPHGALDPTLAAITATTVRGCSEPECPSTAAACMPELGPSALALADLLAG